MNPEVLVGELTLPPGGFTLPLPNHLQSIMAGMVGKHVVLGIRPEHFHLRPVDGGGEASKIDVAVSVIEPLGNDMDVYMATKLSDYVVGRLEAQAGVKPNSAATVYVDTRRVHFFEPGETGMNLSLETSSPTNEPAHALA